MERIIKDTAANPAPLGLFGLFTLVFFIGTLNGNTIDKLIFGSLVVLFALLYATSFTRNESIHTVASYEGILCGFLFFLTELQL